MAACSKVAGTIALQLAITGTSAMFECCCAPQDCSQMLHTAAWLLHCCGLEREGRACRLQQHWRAPHADMQQSVSMTAARMVANGSAVVDCKEQPYAAHTYCKTLSCIAAGCMQQCWCAAG